MVKLLASVGMVALLGISAAGAATPRTEVLATVHQFFDNFSKGDMKAAAAAVSPDGLVIMDDVPPHVWSGANALEAWGKAVAAAGQGGNMTDPAAKIGKPTSVIVDSDSGYVVLPVAFTYKQKGVAMRQAAHMVYSLRKAASGWQITGFTWVAGTPERAAVAGQ
ncbi:MAG TPA: nuclear transport factor 2 family protein [Steroidobacteraceae bacterium]|jgi:ketosteroid isomerase-like protein|nr:nuclear transport factor 2 family protein [Steroidobacteraceae bacterium]